MNELMLRLRRDGKIVGYEYHRCFSLPSRKTCIKIYHIDGLPDDMNSPIGRYRSLSGGGYGIEHDSFDLGMKHGDEWWFVGDKLSLRVEDDSPEGYYEYEGILSFSGTEFYVKGVPSKAREIALTNWHHVEADND